MSTTDGSAPPPPPPPPPPVRYAVDPEPPLITIVCAGLFLYVGFVLSLSPISDAPALYAASVHGFTWMARIVGILLLVIALASWVRIPFIAYIDAACSGLAAFGCLACGAVWIAHNDMEGVLLILFGLLNSSAAWRATRVVLGRRSP